MLWFMGSQRVRNDSVTELNMFHCVYIPHFLYPFINKHFHTLDIANAAVNIGVCVSFQISALRVLFQTSPRSGISGSYIWQFSLSVF